jgi:hypothetical protein
MNFIDQIIKNSQVKEAKLYGPSKKASENPETGITILTPAAFHVIKDCAILANRYLPHFIFGSYANPLEVLKGKFTRHDIEEFVNTANSDIVMFQLMTLILEKIRKTPYMITTSSAPAATPNLNSADPYGEYENFTMQAPLEQQKQQDFVTILCSAFGV